MRKQTAVKAATEQPARPAAEVMGVLQEIPLDKITPNPDNQRTVFAGAKFDELVASIKERGVQNPILVRPGSGDGSFKNPYRFGPDRIGDGIYRIIAGERRFRACQQLGLATIPAIVRDMSDEESLEAMIIENLQREDLSEIEEARAFQKYLKQRGSTPQAVDALAKAVGVSTTYVRRRVKVLELPKEILDLWEKGELIYGHLEQFVRMKDKKAMMALCREFLERYPGRGYRTVPNLCDMIDQRSPRLSIAQFGTEGCAECAYNSDYQKRLFAPDQEMKEAVCLDPGCFRHRQHDWLLAHWEETAVAKRDATNGFRFQEGYSLGSAHQIYGNARKQCKSCQDFISLIRLDGQAVHSPVCGKSDKGVCFSAVYSGARNAPFEVNLGPEFRQKFYREGLLTALTAAPDNDDRFMRIAVSLIMGEYYTVREYWKREGGLSEEDAADGHESALWQRLQGLSGDELRAMLARAVRIRVEADRWWIQHEVIRMFGVDLKDWRITADYLDRKDVKGLQALGKELGIFDDEKVIDYRHKQLSAKTVEILSKKELIALFLKSGVDLAGKVPKEILEVK